MKKFLIGLLAGIILTALAGVIVVLSFARLADRKPTVADGSTLLLKIEGDVPEQAPTVIPVPFFQRQAPATVLEHYQMLRRAGTDSRIKAVVLMPHRIDAGWAKLQELRDGLLAYKKSGKPLIAYLRNPGTREYYLATAADKIYMTHEDLLDLKGMRIEAMFVKNTLDKIGAQVEVEHAGKYKDAGDMFTRTSLTPESREVLNSLLDGIYGNLISTIASGRKQSPETVRAKLDNGPFLADQAVSNGFVDGLRYEDEMFGEVQQQLKQSKLQKLSSRNYLDATASNETGKRIAVITADGAITRGSETDTASTDTGITAFGLSKLLRQVANDGGISGVILRVDSPGGDAIASDDLLREVKLLSQKKPLLISMSDTAASGGYYIAVTGDPILAYPNTVTGSIGVIYGKANLHGLYDKLGIQKELLMRGQNADFDTDYHPLTDRARTKLKEGIDQTYQTFLQRVAEGRKRKVQDIEPLAQGRVWLGTQAKQNGLVDELGGLDRAVEMIKARAKIGTGDKVRLVAYPPKRTLLEQLMATNDQSNVTAQAEAQLQKLVRGVDLRLWTQGGIMRVMPYAIEIK